MYPKVKVEANREGNLISISKNNPEWGWIRLTQTRHILDEETGVMKTQYCSALVQGRIEDLEKLGWEDGMELEGKIIFKDSMTPFRKVNPEKDFKVAGKSGIACTVNGKHIYRKYFYTRNPDAKDVFIQHDEDCRQAIAAAYNESEVGDESETFSL